MIADSSTDAASCKRNPTVIVGLAKDMPTSAVVSPSAAMNACGSFRMSLRSIHDSTIILISYFSRSEEHTSELQSLMRISYAVFCLKKKKNTNNKTHSLLGNSVKSQI